MTQIEDTNFEGTNLPESERLTDVLDRASDNEMRQTSGLVDAIRNKCKRDQEPGPGGVYAVTDCDDCGGEIGEGRLQVAIRNLLCVHCATAEEKRGRMRFHNRD